MCELNFGNFILAPVITTTEFADVKQQALVDSIRVLRDAFIAQLALDPSSSDLMTAIDALTSAITFAGGFNKLHTRK